MFKNLTIRQITLYLTIALTSLFSFLLFVISLGSNAQIIDTKTIVSIVLFSLIGYLLIHFVLQRYIFRRIKLIYKIISKKKYDSSADIEDFIAEGSFDKVNLQVAKWANDTEKEIVDLKKLETYRRNYLGNISHELKTPIFAIQGYLHTLLDGGMYDENINQKYLTRAATNVDRLQNIVEDLEVINELESGDVVLTMSKFDIKKLTEDIFEDLKFIAKNKNIELGFKQRADNTTYVMADRERIRQVLNNLIINSMKYNDDSGKTIVSFYTMDDKVLVEVSDDGIGIEEQHLKHLFDRFYRVDTSRSRAQGGSGLGLAIVKHIIESHDQRINVRSTPGIGSTFGFTLQKA